MYRMNGPRHRKPDIMLLLVALVGLGLAASVTLQVHALSDARSPEAETSLSLQLRS